MRMTPEKKAAVEASAIAIARFIDFIPAAQQQIAWLAAQMKQSDNPENRAAAERLVRAIDHLDGVLDECGNL